MATFTKACLSGSTNGQQILVTSITNGAANTIHTAVAGTAAWDEIWLYAYNSDTVNRVLTLLWGGTTDPNNTLKVTLIPQAGRLLVVDGGLLQNGLIVKAYADSANKVLIDGFVNKIT